MIDGNTNACWCYSVKVCYKQPSMPKLMLYQETSISQPSLQAHTWPDHSNERPKTKHWQLLFLDHKRGKEKEKFFSCRQLDYAIQKNIYKSHNLTSAFLSETSYSTQLVTSLPPLFPPLPTSPPPPPPRPPIAPPTPLPPTSLPAFMTQHP